ncbi:MAG TPA: hypothetical protein VLW44_00865 [Streptosporangiaceae bacterium]|nr:hypothetical protein [Streptosporangiaceae bacterium]
MIPGDFAGLSFERGPLGPGNAGVSGNLFNPADNSLVTLFRNLGLGSLRIGGSTVDQLIPAGTGSDGFAGIDGLFAFAAVAGVKVIYSLRLLSPAEDPIGDLLVVNAQAAGHIWGHYQPHVASFAIGNEPDWHAYHTFPGHPLDPAIYEEVADVPGSAYQSYLAQWRRFADAIGATAPGAPLSGPDLGAYTNKTYTPDPANGVSWAERLAGDERDSGRLSEITQHYYAGGNPGDSTAQQAIGNMLSPEWVNSAAIGTQPTATTYTPYPWLYENNLAPVTAAGLGYRLTESNDYLGGVQGASDAFASALWALDHLHWWAAHGAAGVNFHNRQGLFTDTIVPDPAGGGYAINPKGYGIKAFTLGSAGQVKPAQIQNPGGINLTAYCVGTAGEDYVTVINKAHGAGAPDAAVTIVPPGPAVQDVQAMTLAGGQPGDARGTHVTLGGTTITGDIPWNGSWSTLAADPRTGISLTVRATTAVILRIQSGASPGGEL